MRSSTLSKLTLGTVQLGLPYGVRKKEGLLPLETAFQILGKAAELGVEQLDCARAYGEAEARIGAARHAGILPHSVQVITKLGLAPSFEDSTASEAAVRADVLQSIETSCSQLKTESLDCLMLHRWAHRTHRSGVIWECLRALKKEGRIRRLGASVQGHEEALQAVEDPDVEIIQLPFNLLDWRWRESGFIAKRSRRPDLEIHARSVYLQGILVSPESAWPRISGVDTHLWVSRLESLVRSLGRMDRADLCLAYARSQKWINRLAIGIENVEQLENNSKLFQTPLLTPEEQNRIEAELSNAPAELLNPSLWPR